MGGGGGLTACCGGWGRWGEGGGSLPAVGGGGGGGRGGAHCLLHIFLIKLVIVLLCDNRMLGLRKLYNVLSMSRCSRFIVTDTFVQRIIPLRSILYPASLKKRAT